VPIIIGNKFFQLHKQLCDVIVVRKRGVEDGLNTEPAKNTESANLAGTQSHKHNAKFRRETGDTESAKDTERDTHARSQTPTGNAKGHEVHSQRGTENAAADHTRDGMEARQLTDEQRIACHDRNAQRDDTTTYAHQTGESGDGQSR